MLHLIPGQHVHFVGIGGTGLSAIARILLEQGFYVSGSDMQSNAFTEALKRDGAVIYRGHDPAYVNNAEIVIVTSALSEEHIEVLSARAQGIEVYKRSEIIGEIMRGHKSVTIAGTHGKTTTTAMTTHVLIQARMHPSYIIGGVLANTGQNAGIGVGDVFVIEADEYDNMFHGLHPDIAVITNVEYDHPDFFKTPRELTNSFRHFVGLLPNDGLLIACADDATAEIFANNRRIVDLPLATYGIDNPAAEWRATDIQYESGKTTFKVLRKNELLGTVRLAVPGKHNVKNALAALIVANSQGVSFEPAAEALSNFQGTGRRFEVRGERKGVVVIDDYAHHPTAIKVTIDAARERYPGHQIWAVWQPHTYSRTQQLFSAYVQAFGAADHVLVTDIYAAREKPVPNFSGADVVNAMEHPDSRYTAFLDEATAILRDEVEGPAVILIMSAGDANRIAGDYLAQSPGEVG